MRSGELFSLSRRWLTVRDALKGLPDPREKNGPPNHRFQPGARSYPGHTGSPWDEPAKALKAGDHGVPGGENMLRHANGQIRYFTIRESARLQTFPDDYVFSGSWTESMRQLGNAVPVRLAHAVASTVADIIRPFTGTTRSAEGSQTIAQEDQMKRDEIESKIAAHFQEHPIIVDKETLFKQLALG